jgi:hypothetical protein
MITEEAVKTTAENFFLKYLLGTVFKFEMLDAPTGKYKRQDGRTVNVVASFKKIMLPRIFKIHDTTLPFEMAQLLIGTLNELFQSNEKVFLYIAFDRLITDNDDVLGFVTRLSAVKPK